LEGSGGEILLFLNGKRGSIRDIGWWKESNRAYKKAFQLREEVLFKKERHGLRGAESSLFEAHCGINEQRSGGENRKFYARKEVPRGIVGSFCCSSMRRSTRSPSSGKATGFGVPERRSLYSPHGIREWRKLLGTRRQSNILFKGKDLH